MYLRESTNDYGTPVSVFRCDSCGVEYTVCPALREDERAQEDADGCLSEECETYDPARDVDRLFDGAEGEAKISRLPLQ